MIRRSLVALVATVVITLACGDPTGPAGKTYFRARIDGALWSPQNSLATCGDSTVTFIVQHTDSVSGASEVIVVSVDGIHTLGSYALGDSATGRTGLYAVFPAVTGPGIFYLTNSGDPGTVTFTSLSRSDSLIAGTLSMRVATVSGVADQRTISASFRLEFSPVYTVDHPDGEECLAPVPDVGYSSR
jgi:hypothetical protein